MMFTPIIITNWIEISDLIAFSSQRLHDVILYVYNYVEIVRSVWTDNQRVVALIYVDAHKKIKIFIVAVKSDLFESHYY